MQTRPLASGRRPAARARVDRAGGTPLHRAVAASARDVITLLLDRGADIHAIHGAGPGSSRGYAAAYFQPIDLAIWTSPFWGLRGDFETARLLIDRGAECDLTIAAALGDLEQVTRTFGGRSRAYRLGTAERQTAALIGRRVRPR